MLPLMRFEGQKCLKIPSGSLQRFPDPSVGFLEESSGEVEEFTSIRYV